MKTKMYVCTRIIEGRSIEVARFTGIVDAIRYANRKDETILINGVEPKC